MNEIFLLAKESNDTVTTPCPACGAPVGNAWQGTPVIPCSGSGMPVCRSCAADSAPLLFSLANLAHVVAVTRAGVPGSAMRITMATAEFRAHVFDALQAGRLQFELDNGILPRGSSGIS